MLWSLPCPRKNCPKETLEWYVFVETDLRWYNPSALFNTSKRQSSRFIASRGNGHSLPQEFKHSKRTNIATIQPLVRHVDHLTPSSCWLEYDVFKVYGNIHTICLLCSLTTTTWKRLLADWESEMILFEYTDLRQATLNIQIHKWYRQFSIYWAIIICREMQILISYMHFLRKLSWLWILIGLQNSWQCLLWPRLSSSPAE